MARGLPDYYNPDTLVAQRLVDLNDLLTAVMGFASLDNRGRTLWYDRFDTNLAAWDVGALGNASAPVVSHDKAFVPPSGMKMVAGTAIGLGRSNAFRRFMLPGLSGTGLETVLLWDNASPNYKVRISVNNGSLEYIGEITLYPLTGVIEYEYYDGAANQTATLDTILVAPSDDEWLPVKLVIDPSTGYYIRLIVGQDEYDMSAILLYQSAVSAFGRTFISIRSFANAAASTTGYVGYAIISVDEP